MDVLQAAGLSSVKDGCSPQGQCGCCTVLVDGKARVSCVTPLSRVRGRSVETLEGLPAEVAAAWSEAFAQSGASQCGFCTPGIVMRFEARRRDPRSPIDAVLSGPVAGSSAAPDSVVGESIGGGDADLATRVASDAESALKAHLCRCTGWNGIVESAVSLSLGGTVGGSLDAGLGAGADRRATLESGTHQEWVPSVPLGFGGFSIDTAPRDALVAMRAADGSWVVAESLHKARALSGKVQGRRTTARAEAPIELPGGDWDACLQTSWVEPGYLETDASWCEPGGTPSGVLANGGAFGAKLDSPLPEEARKLADEHGRAVLALWSREDTIRLGSKRPPLAIGMRSDGTGVARVAGGADNQRLLEVLLAAAPGLDVEFVDLAGPPVSANHRCAGWLEALAVSIAAGAESPLGAREGDWFRALQLGGGWAKARIIQGASGGNGGVSVDSMTAAAGRGSIEVVVGAGDPVGEVALRSFVTGAAHMALGLVSSESITVEPDGTVRDLTVRSLGILGAAEMPAVVMELEPGDSDTPVAVSDAVFAAVACALWSHHDWSPIWPTLRKPLI